MPPAKKVAGEGGVLPPPRLLEREEFSDSIRIQGAELKVNFCSGFLWFLSAFSWCRERPQTLMSWVQWYGG